jgi:hypothetical protein
MTSVTFWFVPVEGGGPGVIKHDASPAHVGGKEKINVTMTEPITSLDVKNAIRGGTNRDLESLIGGADKWNRCYLAKLNAPDAEKATLNPRTVVIPAGLGVPDGVYVEVKPSAIMEANDDDHPLVLVYPAKAPAGNPLFFFFYLSL